MLDLKTLLLEQGFSLLQLERTGTEHYALTGLLNGRMSRFIVDTGASNTCIGLDRAADFGMQAEQSEIRAAGAGAIDMETHVSEGNSLEFGSWKAEGIQMVLFDLSHVNHALDAHDEQEVDGILGADILRQALAVIDYGADKLYLQKDISASGSS